MGGNRDMWLALGDPMLAQLTGNDWAEKHKREINTSAAAAAAIMAAIFAPYALGAAGTAAEGAAAGGAAAGAGEAAAGSALAAEAGGGAVGAGSLVGAEMGTAGAGLGSAGYGAAGAGAALTGEEIAALYGGNTAGLLSADTAYPVYMSAMEAEAGGGGTGGLLGAGTSAPGDSMTAAKGMSTWDRIGKGFDTYNKYSKIAGGAQNMLAPPQQPQTPQPKPLTMRQAQSQQGPTDWAAFFGPGLSDEEIRRRQLMMMQYGYGAR